MTYKLAVKARNAVLKKLGKPNLDDLNDLAVKTRSAVIEDCRYDAYVFESYEKMQKFICLVMDGYGFCIKILPEDFDV